MKRCACGMAVALSLFVEAHTGWSQQSYLYTPTAVGGEVTVQGKGDGVLVQEVVVQKGDTLSGISRRFSGHGTYFPQILLFNDIKDPNLIYPGNVFRVPVTRNKAPGAGLGGERAVPGNAAASLPQKQVSSGTEISPLETGREKKHAAREKGAGAAKKQAALEKQRPTAVAAGGSASGQQLFERAVKAYRQEDYRSALELFDRYLAENQGTPMAADASLYKAECYLKLSTQN